MRRFGAEVTWLPFYLHPEYPPEGIPRSQLQARYGEAFHEQLKRTFAAAGLAYTPPPEIVPNTLSALRLNELARECGLHQQLHDRLMQAYWEEARDIGDPGELLTLAVAVGLEQRAAREVIENDAYRERVLASTAQAHSLGISGIPAFLLDRRLLVLGAQPHEVFDHAWAQL